MKHGRHGWSYLALRIGLGLTFTWAGIDMFRQTNAWVDYIPRQLPFGLSQAAAMPLAATANALLGILLLTNQFPRLTATITSLYLAGSIVLLGITPTTTQTIGLLGVALALALWPHNRRSHRLRRLLPSLPFTRRSQAPDG